MSPAQAPLEILYRDQHLIAVHKPPGLLVHRSWISSDREFLLQRLRDQIGQRVWPVHRLDRATSGVILFALDPDTAQRLTQAFSERAVSKTYLALVRGWLGPEPLLVDHPLDDPESATPHQPAQTRFRELARVELPIAVDRYPQSRYSLIEAQPLTGRRHQIRRHLKHLSHPIIGDVNYGKGTHNRFFREQYGVQRLLLHASRLELAHPATGQLLCMRAETDEQWQRLARIFGVFDWSELLSKNAKNS